MKENKPPSLLEMWEKIRENLKMKKNAKPDGRSMKFKILYSPEQRAEAKKRNWLMETLGPDKKDDLDGPDN